MPPLRRRQTPRKRLVAAKATPDPVRLADPAIELGKA